MVTAPNSEFYRWMLHHARLMGIDIDATEQLEGGAVVSRRNAFLVWAAIALSDGLTPDQAGHLAWGLGVSPEEVTAAYLPEMRQAAMEEILEHPDLASLDKNPDDHE